MLLFLMMKNFWLLSCLLLFCSWGFYAHRRINQLAVFTLPEQMRGFYKRNYRYLGQHAADADMRRYADSLEAPRHYLDVENYEKNIDSIPEKYADAEKKYTAKHIQQNGMLPWQIQRSYYKLVDAFKTLDSLKVLKYSSDLGHYVADAHVPLHTTNNHNGQLSNQTGIHGFWESRIPELFADKYNFIIGKAIYIENPLKQAWKIVKNTHLKVDSVLNIEAMLNKAFPADQKHDFSERGKNIVKQYSIAYSKAYQDALNGMVEKQMRTSVLMVGSYWFSAWIDAGQPDLKNLKKINLDKDAQQAEKQQETKINEGKLIGREF